MFYSVKEKHIKEKKLTQKKFNQIASAIMDFVDNRNEDVEAEDTIYVASLRTLLKLHRRFHFQSNIVSDVLNHVAFYLRLDGLVCNWRKDLNQPDEELAQSIYLELKAELEKCNAEHDIRMVKTKDFEEELCTIVHMLNDIHWRNGCHTALLHYLYFKNQ